MYRSVCIVAKKRYQAVGFPYNPMLKLSSSRGIRIDVPVLSVSWSFVDHSVIIQALKKGLIEHEASDTGGVPRWKSSCPDGLAEDTLSSTYSFHYLTGDSFSRPTRTSCICNATINTTART